MRLVRLLPGRVQALAPEALRFGAIGLGNTVLYFAIFNVTMGIGAVKATVIATLVTTTLSYLANRHWTYRSRPKNALRREYILFFTFNLAGMLIQSGVVGVGKYGFGLNESRDRIAFNIATCLGIGLATAFRFWSYRTLVFAPAALDVAESVSLAESVSVAPLPRNGERPPLAYDGMAVDLDIEAEIDAAIDEELSAELAAADARSQVGSQPQAGPGAP